MTFGHTPREVAGRRDLTPRMPGPHVIPDHHRPGGQAADFQHYYNEHRTHAGRQGHLPVRGVNADHSLADLSCYRWQKHCRGLYQKRRLPPEFSNSPPTGAITWFAEHGQNDEYTLSNIV